MTEIAGKSLCFVRFFDFGPGVFQGDRAVEDELFFTAVLVDTEVTDSFKLVSIPWLSPR